MKNPKLDVLGLGTCNADFLMNVSRFSGADDEVDIENLTFIAWRFCSQLHHWSFKTWVKCGYNGKNWKGSLRKVHQIPV